MMIPMRAAILTASDSRKIEDDLSGATLVGLLQAIGAEITEHVVVSDDLTDIREALVHLSDSGDTDLIVTTGGTGFSPRDNMPEATRSVIDREAPGIAEAMRRETGAKTPMAMLSRGIAGIRRQTLIINLPGSPKAVQECFEVIRPVLEHAVNLLGGKADHPDSQ